MTRLPCINPRCRRTAPADKYECGVEIICGKCFRALPQAMRDRHRQLKRRERRLLRRIDRRIALGTIAPDVVERVGAAFARQLEESWFEIRHYTIAPVQPVGLEGFLQEIGL